jgi:hypothetical protein
MLILLIINGDESSQRKGDGDKSVNVYCFVAFVDYTCMYFYKMAFLFFRNEFSRFVPQSTHPTIIWQAINSPLLLPLQTQIEAVSTP